VQVLTKLFTCILITLRWCTTGEEVQPAKEARVLNPQPRHITHTHPCSAAYLLLHLALSLSCFCVTASNLRSFSVARPWASFIAAAAILTPSSCTSSKVCLVFGVNRCTAGIKVSNRLGFTCCTLSKVCLVVLAAVLLVARSATALSLVE